MTISMRSRVAALGGYATAAKYGGVAVTEKARKGAAEVRDERLMAHFGFTREAPDFKQRMESALAFYYRQIRLGRRAEDFLK